MIEIAERFIREKYRKLGLSRAPSKISFVKMGGRRDRFSSVPFACFLGNRESPSFYIKFPRNPANSKLLKAEFNNLREIRKRIKSGAIKNSIPTPMWYNKAPVFTVQNAMSGVPMLSEVTRRNFRKSSEHVLAWLAKFHGETGTRQVVYRKYARGRIGGMRRTIGAYSKATRKIFSRGLDLTLKEGGKAGGIEISLSYIHGDFNPHNILVDGKKLAVFDWEESSINFPFIDIFHYFTVSSFSVGFSRRDGKLSKEDRYQKYFLGNIEEILSKIRNNYGVLTIDEKLFVSAYTFYLAHMAANEIKRDPLINDFELWANMLRMFVTKMENWSRQ